jgi:tRNA-specific 2-thiouridylase
MRAAAHLGIPFLTMDAEDVYKREVADYMIRSYESGVTPNPDVMCNEHVKFGAFYHWSKSYGAHKIATGHYAQTKRDNDTTMLIKGVDTDKDQSYFLWRIKQDVLSDILFPIGDTTKTDIRKEARNAGIPTAHKADSQGICFLGEIDMYTFLSHYIHLKDGHVLDQDGKTIGLHRGALLYTIGQRHGFTISGTPAHTPHYIISRDIESNTITVSTSQPIDAKTEIELTDINELGSGWADNMDALPRYHASPVPVARVNKSGSRGCIQRTAHDTHAWVRGQSCVLYKNVECVGGGVIS